MRLRVLELPTSPVPVDSGPGDGSTVTYRMAEPAFVLVFDEVSGSDSVALDAASVDEWRRSTGARGALVFRSRVDLPGADS